MIGKIWKEALKDDRTVSFPHKLAAAWLRLTRKPLEGKLLKRTLKLTGMITEFLDENGAEYWLEGGTLLGVMRENRLLPWDHDVDLTMKAEDLEKIAKKIRKFRYRYGYRLEFVRNNEDIFPLKKGAIRLIKVQSRRLFILPGFVQVDLFVKPRHEDAMYWTVSNKVLKSTPAKYTDHLTRVDFEGMSLSIPEDYDGYLSYRYGDWRTTQKEYSNISDDKSIVKNI